MLEEMARDIALIEPDPQDLGGWRKLLLEKMDEEAKKRRKSAEFDHMMKMLMKDSRREYHLISNCNNALDSPSFFHYTIYTVGGLTLNLSPKPPS